MDVPLQTQRPNLWCRQSFRQNAQLNFRPFTGFFPFKSSTSFSQVSFFFLFFFKIFFFNNLFMHMNFGLFFNTFIPFSLTVFVELFTYAVL